LVIPPNHTVVCGVKITFDAVSFEIIRGGIIVTGAGETVAILYYFKFHIPVVNFSFPIAGNGLRISKETGEDTCTKQEKGSSYFQYVQPDFINWLVSKIRILKANKLLTSPDA
jgi:hypothetical protein